MTKLCKDCKYHRASMLNVIFRARENFSLCAHPKYINMVTGKADPKNWAEFMRKYKDECGPQGKLWEAK